MPLTPFRTFSLGSRNAPNRPTKHPADDTMSPMRQPGPIAIGLFLTLISAAPSLAQTDRRWEIEGVGGLSRGTVSSSGTATLPEPGAPIPSTSPIFPSRRASSWFFGDGAEMLNRVNDAFGVAARIVPLDEALRSPGLSYSSAAVVGVRARRVISPKLSVELGFEIMPGSGDVSEELVNAASATVESFEAAFRGLFETGPIVAVNVTTDFVTADGSAREVTLTGAVNWHLNTGGSFVPYLTVGGGLVSGMGDLSSVALEGTYELVAIDNAGTTESYRESDQLRLRFERGTTFVGIAGAGMKRDVSDRWGFRIDGRVLIGRENSRLLIDTAPDVQLNPPGDVLETLTNPNIQFSNDPATGRPSTLSGDPLDGFVAFKASGLQTRVLVTVGVFSSKLLKRDRP